MNEKNNQAHNNEGCAKKNSQGINPMALILCEFLLNFIIEIFDYVQCTYQKYIPNKRKE